MDKVNRPQTPKKADLIRLYDVCNQLFKNKECFYSKEEFKKVSKEKIAL
jgi:hypothetical protein